MMNTSWPRMFSLIFTNDSPSGKLVTVASPSGSPMERQISSARGRLELPEKIFSRESVMERAWLRWARSGGRLFCVTELTLEPIDAFEQLGQPLIEDRDPALEQIRDRRRTVDEAARGD